MLDERLREKDRVRRGQAERRPGRVIRGPSRVEVQVHGVGPDVAQSAHRVVGASLIGEDDAHPTLGVDAQRLVLQQGVEVAAQRDQGTADGHGDHRDVGDARGIDIDERDRLDVGLLGERKREGEPE